MDQDAIQRAKDAPLSKYALDFAIWAHELNPINWHDDTDKDGKS